MRNIKVLFLCVCVVLLNGCMLVSSGNNDGEDASYYLCRTNWDSSYTDSYGNECEQQLVFYENGNGLEVFTVYEPGNTQTWEYPFVWYWTSDYFNSIGMEYGPQDRILFDQVRVNFNSLTGYLDGVYAEFRPYGM